MPEGFSPVLDHPIAIVGAGAVGTAIGRRTVQAGGIVAAVVSRTPESARRLAHVLDAPVASTDPADLPTRVRTVFVCVPDDAIADVAAGLAAVDHPWEDALAAHTSGARTAQALAPLGEQGAALLSIHPMQTFTRDTDPAAFEGIGVSVEGDARAVPAGMALAAALGARPMELTAEGKTRYHAAAALASNGLVALVAVVRDVLATAGIEGDDATALMRPLIEQTWANLTEATPAEVLTGPVARGDRGTVQAHLQALAEVAPEALPAYRALSERMIRLAEARNALSADRAEALRSDLAPPS